MAKDHSNDDEEFGEDLEVSSPGKIDTESESGEEMEVSSPGNIDTESESGEEMEVSSPGNITESESKSEPEQPPVATPKKPQPQDSSSSTEEEFDTDSEPDLDPKTQKPNSVVKPISSKPMDDPKKPRSEADKGQVEVVKVENVAATKGKKDGGGKDNWVLVKVKEEKQNVEVEKAVEFAPNLSLILCVESVAALEKWLEFSSPGNIDTESESKSEPEQPPVATPKKPQPQDSSSSTEKEFDSDSEPDLDPKTQKPNSVVKPILSKPMDDPKKPRSEADKGQVEVVKVESVAATKGKKDSGGKDNWVLVEVKEEKQNAEVEKAVEFSPNLSLILCAESVAALEKWLEVSLPGNIDTESESGEEMEVSSPGNVAATKGKNDSGGRDNGVLVEVKEEKLSAEVEKAVEVKRNLNLIPCVENVAGLEKWLEENSGVLSVEKRNEMKEKWEALKVAVADLCLRRVNLIAEQVELVRETVRDSGIEILKENFKDSSSESISQMYFWLVQGIGLFLLCHSEVFDGRVLYLEQLQPGSSSILVVSETRI
ncbi:hypothetical protein BC332_11509 [Capsicum chinense]|nr:hypothetical protein BC332_11509 [Capsicum chinense]